MHMCWGSNITLLNLGEDKVSHCKFCVRTDLVHRCPHLHEFQSSSQISDRRIWKLPMATAGEGWREGRFTVDRSHKIKCKSKAGFQSMAKGSLMLEVVSLRRKPFISILCTNRLSTQMPSFAKLSIIFAHLQSKVLKNVGDNYRENTNNRLAHVEGSL